MADAVGAPPDSTLRRNLVDRRFIPAGRMLFALGNPYFRAAVKNCFVLLPEDDSLEAISKLRGEMARTYAMGGGVGIDLSRLRPHDAPVNNCALTSSGAASFADGFSHLTGEIGQNGRRGALMISISVDHPDVRRFIQTKNDFPHEMGEQLRERLPQKLFKRLVEEVIDPRRACGNSNMSVRITDRFMKAVKEGRPHVTRFFMNNGECIEKVFDARELWNEIITGAWSHGCPGVMFWDTMEREDNRTYLDEKWKIVTVNPCQPGWATVLTKDGIRIMDDIGVGSTIWSGKQWTKVVKKVSTGTKPVYAYRTRAGVFYGTKNHRIVQNGEKVEVQHAEAIDLCVGPNHVDGYGDLDTLQRWDSERVMDGLVMGDGMVHKASNNAVVLLIGENDGDYHNSEIKDLVIKPKQGIKETAWLVDTRIRSEDLPKTYERSVPDWARFGSDLDQRSFLRGLYSANGSVIERGRRIALKQKDKQRKLDAICAIPTRPNRAKTTYGIVETELLGEEPVYDITVEADEHTYWTGGLLVSNCGEMALSDGGSCNLGAINLARFTTDPYTSQAHFDWSAFKQAIRDGIDFLDSVNDIELKEDRAPLKKQAEVTEGLRQVGLGIMGYGDLLLQHQIRYASEDALGFTDKLFRCLRDTAYHQSIMRAKEFGPFPAYDWEKIKRSPFIDRLPAEIKKLMEKHGLRNSNVLSIAPTGTIAIMGETTSGIEPEFAFQLTRACNLGDGKRTKFTYLTPTARRIAAALGKSVPQGEIEGRVDMSWLPEWAVAAHQIDPLARAKTQGLIQQFIDVSISSTVNLPETATVDDVKTVYMAAYEAGCKGITIYREGSRGGVLETLSETERLEYPIEPPLQIKSRRISFKGENGLQRILINVGDYRPGVPCEVSVIHGKSGTEVASYASALGIMISIALQNGVDPNKIARAMEGISAGWATRLQLDGKGQKSTMVQSVPDAVAAVLKKFYGNGIYEKGVLGQPINGAVNKIGWELTSEERKIARRCKKCHKQTYIPDGSCWKCINPACDVDGICG
jgi:ribonucleoside-diphosphate reductase alpha chain